MTVAELKDQARISHGAEDLTLSRLIRAARSHVERITRRAMLSQTWRLTLDRFPCGAIYVPRPPLIAVSSIVYLDESGDEQTLDSDNYRVDADRHPARVVPAYGESWPTTLCEINAVTLTHTAGYGTAASDVPEDLRHAVLLLASHWYEHREGTIVGTISKELEFAVSALCEPYIVEAYG